MERYEKKLFWYLRRITNVPVEDIEDLLQEIFIKVSIAMYVHSINLRGSSKNVFERGEREGSYGASPS